METPLMIKITFSYGYDCQKIIYRQSTCGELTVGPLGLISALETQLGLATPDESFTTRLVQYHQCLKQRIKPEHFFYNSFNENEFSAARTLLQWRDSLYMGGWEGAFDNKVSSRLASLADIEKVASATVAPNIGQRLQRIIKTLATDKAQIAEIIIHDELELLPPIYLTLFDALSNHCNIIEAHKPFEPIATPGTDLYQLQAALIESPKEKISFQQDGSFSVIKASSKSASSTLVAQLIASAYSKKPKNTCGLLCEHESEYLDSALEKLGAPRNANNENTPWRPAFQVLPLCFEILWSPLNPYALLEFLSHPVGPIPKRVREALADCVASQPGIGSENWNKTIEIQLARLEENSPELAERSKRAIEEWIPKELICPNEGISCKEALTRAQKLGDWFTGMLLNFEDKPEYPIYTAALNQTMEFVHAIKDLKEAGIEHLNRESVRHLIAEVRGTGSPLVDKIGDIHPDLPEIQLTNSPTGFCSNQNIIIWWGCENYSSPKKAPWSKKEIAELESESVHLWLSNNRLQLLAEQWLKPIYSADKQLLIVLHPEQSQHHPIMDNIAGVSENWPVVNCEKDLLSQSSLIFGDSKVNTKSISHTVEQIDLPAPARWWQLPEDVKLPKRDRESFSSLDQFINSPYQWVLNYQARLRVSSISEISDGNLLKGSLAHKLFEDYFNEHTEIKTSSAKLRKWSINKLDELLETEGSVLLMPGRQSEALDFKERTAFALEKLINHLVEADIKSVIMEEEQEGLFPGGKLTGYIDLLAENNNGNEVVLDIKWGGFNYRKASIEEDRYLQLATYAALRKEKTGKWPALAYFIISDARLICNDEFYFPNATTAKPESNETTAEFWQRFIHTWKWRREQINKGLIEVTTSNTEPTSESVPDEKCMVIPESSDAYNDFSVLTGLGE